MSSGRRLPWDQGAAIARELVDELTPVVARVKTVGSVRRRKAEVGDVELLVEPREMTVGLFQESAFDIEVVRSTVGRWGEFIRNGDRQMSVMRPDGIQVEVYLCYYPASWGSLLAIRTGPADLGKHAMGCLIERGLRHVDGHVETRRGEWVSTIAEREFFQAAGLPYLPPRQRDSRDAFKQITSIPFPESR